MFVHGDAEAAARDRRGSDRHAHVLRGHRWRGDRRTVAREGCWRGRVGVDRSGWLPPGRCPLAGRDPRRRVSIRPIRRTARAERGGDVRDRDCRWD